jgi:hypothetical protein
MTIEESILQLIFTTEETGFYVRYQPGAMRNIGDLPPSERRFPAS